MRRFPALATLIIALAAISCSDSITQSESAQPSGRIGLAPSFSPAAALAYSALRAFGLEVTSVHIRLVAPDGSTRDTSIAFPTGMEELEIDMSVPLRTAGQSFRADLELLNSDGIVLFSGSQTVVAQASEVLGRGAPAVVTINYTGPGAGAKSVAVSPTNGVIAGAGSLPVRAVALNASGAPMSDLIVRWTTSDGTLATVTGNSSSSATVASTGKRGSVTISAITPLGLTGSTVVALVPVATKIVVVSGGGQTAAAGSALPQPLVVETQAADNLPVPNVAVAFRAVSSGGSVTTATATSDASGRASTVAALGQTAGVYQFEATSASLAPAAISATATAAPAAMISIVSGNFQAGTIGDRLPQQLVVKVVNKFGGPVASATVNWATTSGGGAPSPASSTTGTDGTASTTYTLGTHVQTEEVRASVVGVLPPAGEVSFSLGAIALPPDALIATGSGQHATVGTALPNPLVVFVQDRFGNPVSGEKVSWTAGPNSVGSATFTPTTSTTDATGNASTVATLGATAGPVTITATVGRLTTNFLATADPGTNPVGPGTLSGFVFDGVSGAALTGATVTVFQGTQTVGSATTSNGNYTTTQLPAGSYSVSITANGYTTVGISTVTINGNTQAPAVPMVPASTATGRIEGTVVDATNNHALTALVTLDLRLGVNATTGTPLQTVTASTDGDYQFTNIAAGTYTIVAKAPGYSDATKTGISVGGATTGSQDIFMSPVGQAGNVRIVLTWLPNPRDLDSYLSGPTPSGNRFLVWYGDTGDCTATPFACLDNDVTSGSGPETITMTQQLPGIYRYSVHRYSGSPALSQSGARVDVYINNALAQSFAVPAGNGDYWTVFELNGTAITSINTIGNGSNFARIPTGAGVSASRIPTSAAGPSAAHSDNARIQDANNRHPKRQTTPR